MLEKIALKIKRKKRRFIRRWRLRFNPWPMPKSVACEEPIFLFLITPRNSGSSAMAAYLGNSPEIGKLHSIAEGQFLIGGLCDKDNWDPNKVCNYQSIYRTWMKTYDKRYAKNPDNPVKYIIEKSPPNMVRYKGIFSMVKSYRVVCSNRDPYATISSLGYRYYGLITQDQKLRNEIVTKCTYEWISRAKVVQAIVEKEGYPLITYEKFCEYPRIIAEKFGLPESTIQSIIEDKPIKVKDYKPQLIENMNQKQISRLSNDEIAIISDILREHQQILDFFGYSLR